MFGTLPTSDVKECAVHRGNQRQKVWPSICCVGDCIGQMVLNDMA